MAVLKISSLSGDNFRLNPELHNDIIRLAEPSYENAEQILSAVVPTYDTIYVARDDNDELLAFFMCGFENIAINDEITPTIHLGWTCAARQSKGSGAAQALYKQFVADSQTIERSTGNRFLLWSTTLTPVGVHLYHKYFADVFPDIDGNYSPETARIAEALRRRLNAPKTDAHPFVLKGTAAARFSEQERMRIKEITANKSFTLFDKLGINERDGDRLLVICKLAL